MPRTPPQAQDGPRATPWPCLRSRPGLEADLAGNADVDGGNCILDSPNWATANASTLSVWYWHGQRDAGDDASGDFFLLEYSTDGGTN